MKQLVLIMWLFPFLGQGQTFEIDAEKFPGKYREFDFWIGEWDVNLRRIQSDNTWQDWKQSRAEIYSILDGRAILELWEEKGSGMPAEKIIGYSLRYYDPASDEWILWLNWPGVNRSGSSSLTGTFRHMRGEFFSTRQTSDSTSIISRYSFSDISPISLRWDDAFSRDEGKTWTNNWIMEFSRAKILAEWTSGSKLHTFRNGDRCTIDPFGNLQAYVGKWSGKGSSMDKDGKWQETDVSMNNFQSLGGCSVMTFLQVGSGLNSFREFGLLTYNTYAETYENGRLSNEIASSYVSFYGNYTANQLELSRKNPSTGEVIETTKYRFDNQELFLEKWEIRNEVLVKVFEVALSVN